MAGLEIPPLDIQLLVQAILYFTATLTGLITAVPVGVTTSSFDGDCVLYGEVTWNNATSFKPALPGGGVCQFIVYYEVFAGIFYSLGMGIYSTYAVCKKDKTIGSQMWIMPFTLVNSLITVITFIAACILSVGVTQFCDSFKSGKDDKGAAVSSCKDAQLDVWAPQWKSGGRDYDAGTVDNFMTTAQGACWVSFLVWACQFALCVLRIIRNRRARSSETYQEPNTSDKSTIADNEVRPI